MKLSVENINTDLFNSFIENVKEFLPIMAGLILYVILGWFVVKIMMYILKKALSVTKIRVFFDNINQELSKNPNSSFDLFQIMLMLIRFFVIFVLVLIGTDLFGMTMASQELSKIVSYLPKLFVGIAIFVVGVYFASHLKKSVATILSNSGFSGGKVVSRILYGVLFVFIVITALNQAGIDTNFLTNNLSIVIGVIFVTIALALGLGSRNIVEKILYVFYARRTYKIGEYIKVGDVEGTISDISNLSLTITDSNGDKIVYPIKNISNTKIIIVSKKTT